MTTTAFQVSNSGFKKSLPIKLVLACFLLLTILGGATSTTVARNRCKDRCNEVYRLKKDLCRSVPLKGERKSCEKAAKRAKDNCKHRCR